MARRWLGLLVVSAAVFMTSLDLFIVNIAFPAIRADFTDASVGGLSWVLSAYAIVFAALLVPAGRWADRIGRRRAFQTGLVVFTVASALCAVAPTVELLVAARALQAVGAAVLRPTSLGLLLPEFPPEQRAAAVGAWAAVGAVAAAAGPPIGGLLVELSWHWVFLVNVPLGLVTLLFGARVLREIRDPAGAGRPDVLGAVALAVAVGALVLGLVRGPEVGWAAPETLASFAVAALGLVAFGRRCAHHPVPVVELPMLRVRSFAAANVATLLFFAGFAGMLLGSVTFLTGVWGHSVLRAGLELSPGPAMAATFAIVSGRLVNRVGQRDLILAGTATFALGTFFWILRAGPEPDYAADFLPGMMLTGIGVGLCLASLASAAAASLPPARFATGAAVHAMARQLGTALGVAAFVAIVPVTGAGAFDGAWWFIVATAVAAAAAALALGRVTVPVEPDPGTAPAPAPVTVAA